MGDFNDPFMRNRDASVQGRGKVQNRANVLQLKLIGQSHPTGLTNNLLKLFEPRPPLEYKPPPEKRKCLSYSGMGQYVRNFAEPGEPEYSPPVQKGETRVQRRARIHELRLEKGAIKASEELQKYDPSNDPNMTGDPYKTLFVARLNHESTEQRIKREFETYGPIKRVRLITDKETNKPRGYAFIEYMHTRDMKAAYKQADGRKLDNRRVIVDVERGRTVPNWRPRRLGGGLGSTRVGGEDLNQRYSGREQQVTSGGPPRSEEPRSRDDRLVDREREKSRDRGRERDRERERSHERTHDRGGRDRDAREDRQHRDRDRNRDRDRGRDRDRDRHRGRERDRGRDYEQDRDHPREREREYDRAGRGRERDYGNVEYVEQKHGWNRENDDVEPEHGQGGHERDRNLRDQEKYGRGHHEPTYDLDHYEGHIEGELKQEDGMEADDDRYRNQFSRGGSEPGEAGHAGDRDYEYRRSERSLSREFDH